jgi:hypothetical protein
MNSAYRSNVYTWIDLNNVLHVACNYHYFGWVHTWKYLKQIKIYIIKYGGSRDCMVVGFITTYAISAHHH